MKVSLYAATLLVSLVAQAATPSQGHSTWPDGAAVVLLPPRGKEVLRFCSRTAPKSVSGFWEVPVADVVGIDVALAKHLRDARIDKKLTLPVPKYQRQYLGVLRGTERFIYINAFAARFRSAVVNSRKEMPRICDGGTVTWGIEYDVTKRVFLGFAPNY